MHATQLKVTLYSAAYLIAWNSYMPYGPLQSITLADYSTGNHQRKGTREDNDRNRGMLYKEGLRGTSYFFSRRSDGDLYYERWYEF